MEGGEVRGDTYKRGAVLVWQYYYDVGFGASSVESAYSRRRAVSLFMICYSFKEVTEFTLSEY